MIRAVFFLCAAPALAIGYTDPGSGALLWQILTAALVGALFQLRKVLPWFRK